jgi:hypothetical protein
LNFFAVVSIALANALRDSSSADAFHKIRDKQYSFGGFEWECVGWSALRANSYLAGDTTGS